MEIPSGLFERDAERSRLRAAVASAGSGEGAVLTIEGEAGAGKTSLMGEAAALAEDRDLLTLRARGGEFERDFPFGVIRQLFDPVLRDSAGADGALAGIAEKAAPIFRADGGSADEFHLQHGLFWLLADLAERRPLALLVDDAHWADAASLRALAYLARRLEAQPAVLVVAVRTGTEPADRAALEAIRREPGTVIIEPAPLTTAATAALLASKLGQEPRPELAAACCEVTAGNPLYLVELMRALGAEELAAVGSRPEELARLAGRGLAAAVRARLDCLGEQCVEVARATAILEPNAEVRRVALLAGLEQDAVAEAAERLIASQLLFDARPLAFVHPLVRAAVYSEVSAPGLAAAHSRAARILAEDGAARDSVAANLLLAEPAGDAWVVECLRTAAQDAVARGAPAAAVRYLRRALREPAPPAERSEATFELGIALLRANDREGVDVLRGLRAGIEDPVRRANIAVELGNSLALRGGCEEGAAVLEESLDEVGGDGELGMYLRCFLLLQYIWGLERPPADPLLGDFKPVAGDSRARRVLMGATAVVLAAGCGPVDRATAYAEVVTAASEEELREDSLAGMPPQAAGITLAFADRCERGEELLNLAIETARLRAAAGLPGGYGARSLFRLLNGDLREAQLDAELAMPVLREIGLSTSLETYLAVAVRAMVERGQVDEATVLIADYMEGGSPGPGFPGSFLLTARGQLKKAQGLQAEARLDFLAAGERLQWVPSPNPEMFDWRARLAAIEHTLGQPDRARELAAEGVEQARALGAKRALGVALRGHGVVCEGEERLDLLRQSVEALTGTGARLQWAQSLVELGAALRRANRRREAREPLREGLDLAHRCGAAPLEERARTELAATGARPRSAVLSGVEALTPSELRVARMAAAGSTNREVAQELFVTPKTVETHLRHAYQKLGIAGRPELGAALGE
jgi:DNA-binding CsgD family transcriptional regulator